MVAMGRGQSHSCVGVVGTWLPLPQHTHPAIGLLEFAADLLPLGIAPLGHQINDGRLIRAWENVSECAS